jgi:hypothetical protein
MTIDWGVEPLPSVGALSPEAAALKASVLRLPEQRFAVLDGALHDDLANGLAVHGLIGRALFLEAGGAQAIASGPFLVALPEARDVERLFAFLGAGQLPVFWAWPAGETALFRHLRTLNLVEIPRKNRLSEDEPARAHVIFRHWDRVVLGQMLPLLRPGQATRLLGSAHGLCLADCVTGRPMIVGRPVAPVESGMLRFSPEQMQALTETRRKESRRRIADYLRESIPEKAASLTHEALLEVVARSEAAGRGMGLASERSLGLWAFLWLRTDEAVATSYEIRHLLTTSGLQPEKALDAFLESFMAMTASP